MHPLPAPCPPTRFLEQPGRRSAIRPRRAGEERLGGVSEIHPVFDANSARALLEEHRFDELSGIRQWIESVFDTMKGKLSLEHHGGRTIPGVFSRVAARLLALAAGIWHNWLMENSTNAP